MKKISVITINYNNAAGLEKTIKSVIGQTFKDRLEYIVIDGGSSDGSKDILAKYANELDYSVSERDSGIYNAMNKGIAKANGEYCLFLNSGDYLSEKEVLSQVAVHLDGTDIVYGDIYTEEASNKRSYIRSQDNLDFRHFVVSTLWHPASFIKRELFAKYGCYDEGYKIAADYGFFVKTVVKYKVSAKHIPLAIAVFNLDGVSNNSASFQLMVDERKKIQALFFSPEQLKDAELLEIRNLGRNSVFYKFIPAIEWINVAYDKFYYHWYKRRTS
ncbi:glycosyl transferase [Sphingobacteriaceae bacterium]|nr:glycosyl transferase [Sphingobacteriaceae bacterium]